MINTNRNVTLSLMVSNYNLSGIPLYLARGYSRKVPWGSRPRHSLFLLSFLEQLCSSPWCKAPTRGVQSVLEALGTHNDLARALKHRDWLTSILHVNLRVVKTANSKMSKNPMSSMKASGITLKCWGPLPFSGSASQPTLLRTLGRFTSSRVFQWKSTHVLHIPQTRFYFKINFRKLAENFKW